MSGVLLFVDPKGPDPALAAQMLATLSHRGPDGSELVVLPGAALGHQHFWTTPEDVGGRQPLASTDGLVHVSLDGRIDNREDLIGALGCDPSEGRSLSDAAIVLRAYDRWGEGAFVRLLGSFAVALLDERSRRVLLVRDPLGDRSLFYWTDGRRLVAASEPVAVLAHPAVSRDFDESRLARLFALNEPEPGSTFFKDVKEVPLAHMISFRSGCLGRSRYWEASPFMNPAARTDEEWGEAFVETLDLAVAARLRTVGRAGVLLSGGLDSGPVTALAARRTAPAPLLAISWVFDRFGTCDERRYTEEISRMWGLELHPVLCDDAWPFNDFPRWPLNPNSPQENPFRWFLERGYGAARAAGSRVLLSGYCGDDLYVDSGDWLIDLLREARLRDAWCEMTREAREMGTSQAIRSRLISPLVPSSIRRKRSIRERPWLTPYARSLGAEAPPPEKGRKRTGQRRALSSEWIASGVAGEDRRAALAGVEVRYPLRDRRLVELALSLPSHQLHRGRKTRPIVRNGFRGLLPSNVLSRKEKASFRPLVDRAMLDEGEAVFRRVLSGGGLSRRFVEDSWVTDAYREVGSGSAQVHDLVLWYCVFLDLWCERTLG